MNFEKVIERKHTNSMKWDMLQERYQSDDLWPMWVADMDFQAPKPVLDAMQKVLEHGIFGYHKQPDSLFEATTAWLNKRFDWQVDKKHIVYTPGVVPAISHLIQAFTNKGDGVIIQPPVYYPFYALIHNNERKLLKNPLKETEQGFTVDLEDLEEKMKQGAKMLLLCSPHNPIGRVWTEEELREIGHLCEKYEVIVASDEIHADVILKGEHIPFVKVNHDRDIQMFTCLAPSKTFNLAALQLSYVVFENDREKRIYDSQLKKSFVGIDNPFSTAAAEAAYREGESWLEEFLDYVRQNVDYVADYIEENMPKLRVIKPEGTYLIWIDFKQLGMNGKELESWLRQEGQLALSDGHIFGEEGDGYARMNVACPRANVEEGLTRLKTAYDQFNK